MTYQQELDDVRQEVRRGTVGAPLYLWPKQDGMNVVALSASFTVYTPTGEQLDSAPAAGIATYGTASRIQCLVNMSAHDVGENWRLDVEYTTASGTFHESLLYDNVVEPMGSCGVSMNDLLSEQADAQPILQRQASLQEEGRTAQQQAAILAIRAWGDVRTWLKKKVEATGGTWPLFIVNREELRGVVVAQALHRMIIAQGVSSPELREQAEWWRQEAQRRFAELPALQYSSDNDAAPDGEISSFAVVETRRSW